MTNGAVLTISRLWHEPQIKTVVTEEGIFIGMLMPDVLKALHQELHDTVTLDTLETAMKRVLQGMKEETAKVV